MTKHTCKVVIVGAGPAGLLLSHLLDRHGISNIVLERRSRLHCEMRIRAGVFEFGAVNSLRRWGVAERLDRFGMRHSGLSLASDGLQTRIDFEELTGGRYLTIYGQQELVKDLIALRLACGGDVRFESTVVGVLGLEEDPRVAVQDQNGRYEIRSEFVIACDGAHSTVRGHAPSHAFRSIERSYPFAWLGLLVEAPPNREEILYQYHELGFGLYSMRSPALTRLYLQAQLDDPIASWTDSRLWQEIEKRFRSNDGWSPNRGRIAQKTLFPVKSRITTPMQFGRLFLAGDAAHVFPPTGAKGLNIAISDVAILAEALAAYYGNGDRRGLREYSDSAFRSAMKACSFSRWFTAVLHRFPESSAKRIAWQKAQLRQLIESQSSVTRFAECYVDCSFEAHRPAE